MTVAATPSPLGAAVLGDVAGEVRELARRTGLSTTIAGWLWASGRRSEAEIASYLRPKLADLPAPESMADRGAAAARLAAAIRGEQRVTVFGDYDCDGITSAAIMTEVIRALGGKASALLANRFDGGYGVSDAAADRILASRPDVLVTCDCGSSDHPRLRRVAEAGVDIVVIDHHLVPDEPLPALAFLNPHRPECGYPYKGLASCGLALNVAAALRKELNANLDLRRWLDLVALGTIADVAPLDGDNRALVRAGLERLRSGERPGIRALLELAKVDTRAPLTGRDVSFRIAPRINAPGRMGAPDLALQLLMATDEATASGLAAQVEQQSVARRSAQDTLLEEAQQDIERLGWDKRRSIVVGRQGWNHGIVGIVAGRLAEKFRVPVCVIGFDGEVGSGSLRGPAGARLYDALAQTQDLVVRFGGHQAAAGVTLREGNLDAFRQRFEEACAVTTPSAAVESPRGSVVVDSADDPRRILQDLELLEPCGEKNPRPGLSFTAVVDASKTVGNGHLQLRITTENGHKLRGFGPGLGQTTPAAGSRVRILGDLRADTWQGGDAVEVLVEKLEPLERSVT